MTIQGNSLIVDTLEVTICLKLPSHAMEPHELIPTYTADVPPPSSPSSSDINTLRLTIDNSEWHLQIIRHLVHDLHRLLEVLVQRSLHPHSSVSL